MKFLFVIWMLFTVILAISLLGWFILNSTHFQRGDPTPSAWMQLGSNLLNRIESK